jgi:catechol 2,3-dioxygenase-like lactoylglutathione lyase family enzyme
MSPAADRPALRWRGVCIDCADARELADFYARLLGWEVSHGADDWFRVDDPAGGVGLNIQADPQYTPPVWPERPNSQAKMLHFEIEVDDVDAAARYAMSVGASEASPQPADRDPRQLRVMYDPAGHPFCLYNDNVAR